MTRRLSFRKIFATVILTLLIWVWADLALDEQLTVSNAKISVAKSVNPALWVTFAGQPAISLEKVVLKGSARKVAEVRQRINQGSFVPDFYFDPEHEKTTAAGEHMLNVAEFLKGTDKVRQLGLTVVSADPNKVTVNIVELQKKQLTVRCYDDSQNPLKAAGIEPAQVEAFVPAEREGAALEARVVLGKREIEQAKLAAVEKTPYVELAPGQTREAATSVKITLPKEQQRLQEYLVTSVRLTFSLSANLQGKYRVELANPDAVMGAIAIRATPEAKRAYDNVRYQVILEIDDSDKDVQMPDFGETASTGADKSTGPGAKEPVRAEIRRQLVYNFPEEFVRRDEIMLNQSPVQARFRVVPLSVEGPAAAPATSTPAVQK
ncbi:MAG: hypothetical protein ABSG82_03960 [Sedimentisphaerales bacterium]|jgi:hypothetical protein